MNQRNGGRWVADRRVTESVTAGSQMAVQRNSGPLVADWRVMETAAAQSQTGGSWKQRVAGC